MQYAKSMIYISIINQEFYSSLIGNEKGEVLFNPCEVGKETADFMSSLSLLRENINALNRTEIRTSNRLATIDDPNTRDRM